MAKSKHVEMIDRQREAQLISNLEAFQSPNQFSEKCSAYMELALLYLKAGAIEKLLQTIEQLDTELVGNPKGEFLVFVYYVRAELAYFYGEWKYLMEYCETAISIAMRKKNYMYLAQFYKMLHQVTLLNKRYEQSRIYCKLALYFARKGEPVYQSLVECCQLGLLLINYSQNKLEEAKKIVSQCVISESDNEMTRIMKQLQQQFGQYFETGNEENIQESLNKLWELKQYNLVKVIILLFEQQAQKSDFESNYGHFMKAFEMTESVLQYFEKFAYYDQIRAVYFTNSKVDKIRYTSGESYRQELQQKIDEALPEQFITIVTFIIKVNDSDLLSRHLKIKYDYHVKIDRELNAFYPESTSGKYYPTSFCSMFVTEQPIDLISVGNKCQSYLNEFDLVLEDKKIQYYFFAGASSIQKQDFTTLHELYQQADQSLYYAAVMQKTIVIYGK